MQTNLEYGEFIVKAFSKSSFLQQSFFQLFHSPVLLFQLCLEQHKTNNNHKRYQTVYVSTWLNTNMLIGLSFGLNSI